MNRGLFFKGFFLLAIVVCLMNTSCSTLNELLGDGDSNAAAAENPAPKEIVKFSDNQNVLNPVNRQYHRTTRAKIEEESDLGAHAGSMWTSEGQGAYLFAQNKTRREGDLLNVKLEGSAQKQVDTKVSVIKKLIKQLEEEDLKGATPPAGEGGADQKTAVRAPAAADAAGGAAGAKKDEKDEAVDVSLVPTKIVERMPDGNYRIKGAQPFMIGKREYKVIVTGMIRSEDFNEDGVSSGKLLDPQFDVVSIRRGRQ